MDEQQAFNFLDLLAIFNTGLQLQGYVNQVTRKDILIINQKLDRLLLLVEGSSTDADRHPSNAP